jgi:hypothetical protein
VDQSGEEGAGSEDDGLRSKTNPELGHHADDSIALDEDVVDGLLEERKLRLMLETLPDSLAVERAVRLRACGAYRWAFGGV